MIVQSGRHSSRSVLYRVKDYWYEMVRLSLGSVCSFFVYPRRCSSFYSSQKLECQQILDRSFHWVLFGVHVCRNRTVNAFERCQLDCQSFLPCGPVFAAGGGDLCKKIQCRIDVIVLMTTRGMWPLQADDALSWNWTRTPLYINASGILISYISDWYILLQLSWCSKMLFG